MKIGPVAADRSAVAVIIGRLVAAMNELLLGLILSGERTDVNCREKPGVDGTGRAVISNARAPDTACCSASAVLSISSDWSSGTSDNWDAETFASFERLCSALLVDKYSGVTRYVPVSESRCCFGEKDIDKSAPGA